jgi:hypothetical protein
MARNLQSKLSPRDRVRLFDINTAAAEQLAHEMKTSQAGGAAVQLAKNAADAAKGSVCQQLLCMFPWQVSYDELFILPMI